ncbi:FAD-binding protein [Epibacterium ulvae]|uniref:FAD-binding oxidoreductase n=1 Tax=Epibacterium ulvae TaxID=1156985 RepID=UPI001BFC1241|nr:FAD-linked oxidase C-terminal domain-containing protein [Epibacterium ulvae]MBT8153431.1 FAD-binding protein [Epibacterium ulvae]
MAAITTLPRNEAGIATVIAALSDRFADRLHTGQSMREQHGHTTTSMANQIPDAVVFVTSTDEVAEVVKLCALRKVPVIPFGTGSSLEGHLNAPAGGISLDLSQMNQIKAVHAADLDVVVQPGVTREQLNTHLRDQGLFFPIDPGANASLGGMAATRASGTNAVRYGTMKDNILSLEAVMADGTIIRTGARAKKSSAGYDMARLLIGSEGTLGVITELTLRLQGVPEAIRSARCSFPSVEAACQAVMMTIQYGIPVARIELLDVLSVRAAKAYSKLDLPEVPLLLLEFHGSDAGVIEQSDMFASIAEEFEGQDFAATSTAEERNKLWQARHDVYWASHALRPGAKGLSTDVCVPISRLAECVSLARAKAEELDLLAPMVGHVGDGNFHALLLLEPGNAAEQERADSYLKWLADTAIAMEGTCTGEHGVGQGKRSYVARELGETIRFMAAIKSALDPDNIMNPGKILSY